MVISIERWESTPPGKLGACVSPRPRDVPREARRHGNQFHTLQTYICPLILCCHDLLTPLATLSSLIKRHSPPTILSIHPTHLMYTTTSISPIYYVGQPKVMRASQGAAWFKSSPLFVSHNYNKHTPTELVAHIFCRPCRRLCDLSTNHHPHRLQTCLPPSQPFSVSRNSFRTYCVSGVCTKRARRKSATHSSWSACNLMPPSPLSTVTVST